VGGNKSLLDSDQTQSQQGSSDLVVETPATIPETLLDFSSLQIIGESAILSPGKPAASLKLLQKQLASMLSLSLHKKKLANIMIVRNKANLDFSGQNPQIHTTGLPCKIRIHPTTLPKLSFANPAKLPTSPLGLAWVCKLQAKLSSLVRPILRNWSAIMTAPSLLVAPARITLNSFPPQSSHFFSTSPFFDAFCFFHFHQ
jgi:hypothetical protein